MNPSDFSRLYQADYAKFEKIILDGVYVSVYVSNAQEVIDAIKRVTDNIRAIREEGVAARRGRIEADRLEDAKKWAAGVLGIKSPEDWAKEVLDND